MKNPFLLPVIFFISGIISAAMPGISSHWEIAAAAAACCTVLVLVSAIKKQKLFYSLLCLFFFFIGFFRYSTAMVPCGDDISLFTGGKPREVMVYGTVSGYPGSKVSKYGHCRIFPFKVYRLLEETGEKKGDRNDTGTAFFRG